MGKMWWWFFLVLIASKVHASPPYYHSTEEIQTQIQYLCHKYAHVHCRSDSSVFVQASHLSAKVNMFVFGEHARELISSEIALHLLLNLSSSPPVETSYIILPIANSWGRKKAEKDQTCLRTNEHGVDLNRNFPTRMGESRSLNPGETYGGPRPFSEFETQRIKQIVHTYPIDTYVSIHSGDLALYLPWDGSKMVPPNIEQMMKKVRNLQSKYCPNCLIGPAGKVASYLCSGTGTDYVFEHSLAKMAFTFEVWSSSSWDCFKRFNPHTKQSYQDTVTRWTQLLKYL